MRRSASAFACAMASILGSLRRGSSTRTCAATSCSRAGRRPSAWPGRGASTSTGASARTKTTRRFPWLDSSTQVSEVVGRCHLASRRIGDVTGSAIIPMVRYYRDAVAAIEWLCEAFGFEKRLVVPGDNGSIRHAQLTLGERGMVLVASLRGAEDGVLIQSPQEIGGVGTQMKPGDRPGCCCASRSRGRGGADVVLSPVETPQGFSTSAAIPTDMSGTSGITIPGSEIA